MSFLSNLESFAKIAATVVPIVLQFTPFKAIAGPVAAAIAEAEQIVGASGADKLAHVTNVAVDAAAAVNAQAGTQVVDPAVIRSSADKVISDVVDIVNKIQDAQPNATEVK